VFYTVKIKDGLFIKKIEFYGGEVNLVIVTDKEINAYVFHNQDTAKKATLYVGGTIIKHTETTVITDVTEEIQVVREGVE